MVRPQKYMSLGESSRQEASRRVQHESAVQVPNFLDFSMIPLIDERRRFEKKLSIFRRKEIQTGGSVDWEIFKDDSNDQPSIYEDLSTYLDVDYVTDGGLRFKTQVWRELFSINEPLYEEFILEFFSTYSFRATTVMYDDDTVIKFRLGGINRQLSLIQLASILGIYPSPFMSHPHFVQYLRHSYKEIPDFRVLLDFWKHIGDGDYNERLDHTNHIQDPRLRLFHHLLIKTITSRNDVTNKVTKQDLFLLYCIAHRVHVNIPYWIAKYFYDMTRRRDDFPITGGCQYITRIARHFGLLTTANLQTLKLLPPMETLGKEYWVLYGVCKPKLGGHVNLVWATLPNSGNTEVENIMQEQNLELMGEKEPEAEPFRETQEFVTPDLMELGNTENMMQLLTDFDANLGELGSGNAEPELIVEEHETTNPNTSLDQWFSSWTAASLQQQATTSVANTEQRMPTLEEELQQLKAQLNEDRSKQEQRDWQSILNEASIIELGQKLDMLSQQMEWIRIRLEQIYPPGGFPQDPWPTMYQPHPQPPPQ